MLGSEGCYFRKGGKGKEGERKGKEEDLCEEGKGGDLLLDSVSHCIRKMSLFVNNE